MSVPAPSVSIADGGGSHGAGPRHVAIIMDGNGRWAKKRMLPRAMGHRKRRRGSAQARPLVARHGGGGADALCLQSENWKRTEDEIADLTMLMKHFIRSDLGEMIENGVRLRVIGDHSAFEPESVALIDDALARTAHNTRHGADGCAELWRAAGNRARRRRRRPFGRGDGGEHRRPISTPRTCRRSTC